ncbi:MAG: sugar ABC transporter permease [Lachnospiraceae bacterium]|nr:sugar ABC transporter permease [Lachnospiraceae bacterium]
MKKHKRLTLVKKRGLSGYLFILPVIIGLIFIFLPAVIESLIYSFNDVVIEFNHIAKTYVGFQNYYDAFMSDASFRVVLLTAAKGIFVDSAVVILFSFFMANVLNQKFKGRGFARTIFFLPVVLAVGIVADMENANSLYNAMDIVSETSGTGFDQMGIGAMFSTVSLMSKLGLPGSVSKLMIGVINNMYNVVNSSGVQILIFLSALQSINPSVFEAAKVEGATKWEEFWKITFPMITPSLLVCVVYTIIDTFTNPVYQVMDYIQKQAFSSGKMGYAASLSWIYFLIVIVVLGLTAGIISKKVTYLE